MKRTLTTVAIAASLTASASAQSFNVEWGSLDSSPPDTYRGVGLPGVWNTFDAMPNFVRFPLVDLNGDPIPADIMNIGFDVVEVFDNPLTSGGDAALLDDCFTSFNDPIDGCIFMRFLEPGEYLVVLYGMTPDDDTNLSRMRIDQNTLPPVLVGGAWPGFHQSGITYMIQEATVGSDGRLDFHSGDQGTNVRSVLNGMQVIKREDLCIGDCDTSGEVNFADLVSMLFEFGNNTFPCDADGSGTVDFGDLVTALFEFGPCS